MPRTKPETSFTVTWTDSSAKSTLVLTPRLRGVTIGRSAEGISLTDEFVSRTHALLYRTDDGFLRVRDQNSSNGTYLNGVKVNDAPVQLGDELRIGHTTLRFVSPPTVSDEVLRGWPNHWACIPKDGQENFAPYYKTKSN